MIPASVHHARRVELARRVGRPILMMGNGRMTRNLPLVTYPFRQDSAFLYAIGCDLPDAAAVIEPDGSTTLFLPAPGPDDALWHGHVDDLAALSVRYGLPVEPAGALAGATAGRQLATLAVSDPARCALGARLAGDTELSFGEHHGDDALVDALIAMRRVKDDAELAAMRQAAAHSAAAHLAVMRATRPGAHEQALTALFEAVLAARGCTTGYGTILTQRGEILHMEAHDQALEAGRLLLIDAGGEVPSGYGVDITRTMPVSGAFSARQRAAYDAVLEAQLAAIARCTPGTPYRDVHDVACHVIARFLRDEGLLRVSPEEAVERGSHALFFPHGVGHHLGLDVHDLENFGDRPSYPRGVGRPEPFGTRNLRLNLPLEDRWVVTVEPGFYVVPAILADRELRAEHASAVDFDRAEAWLGFGGIRIEDDVVVRATPEVLTAAVPKAPDAIEAVVGTEPLPSWLRS